MELELTRTIRTNRSTIGEPTIDGKFECFILEDKDRGIQQAMALWLAVVAQHLPSCLIRSRPRCKERKCSLL